MRKQQESVLKESLRVLALKTRDRLDVTQKDMAIKFSMSDTAYQDIETGVSMCGTPTAILLLIEQDDPGIFLNEMKGKFEELYEKEMENK